MSTNNATSTRLFRFGAMLKGDHLDQAYRLADWENQLNTADGLEELQEVVQVIYFSPLLAEDDPPTWDEEASTYASDTREVVIRKYVRSEEDIITVFLASIAELVGLYPELLPLQQFLEKQDLLPDGC